MKSKVQIELKDQSKFEIKCDGWEEFDLRKLSRLWIEYGPAGYAVKNNMRPLIDNKKELKFNFMGHPGSLDLN